MGGDQTSGVSDEPDEPRPDDEQSGSARRPPADRPGEPGYHSRVESRRTAMEAGSAAAVSDTGHDRDATDGSEASQEISERREQGAEGGDEEPLVGSRDEAEAGQDVAADREGRDGVPVETDLSVSSLERMPSYGGFDNLADEFEARAKSRNPNNEQPPEGDGERDSETRLDGKSIRDLVDPFAPDLDKAEGRKNPFQRPVKDSGAGWTDGVDSLNDLPAGDELAEGDPDVRSTGKNFRRTLLQRYDDASDGISKYTSTASDFFKPHPTGHAETRVDSGPMVADVNHPGIDPGNAASSLLALGIVGAELLRWSRDKIKREVRDEGHG